MATVNTTTAHMEMDNTTTVNTTTDNTTKDNTTTANMEMDNTTTVNTTTVNTTMVNTTMDNTTTATTTVVSAVDSQMEVDVSVTTDSHSETSMGTLMEPAKGRTTRVEPGATQRDGATLAVEICKRQSDSQTTHGLTRP